MANGQKTLHLPPKERLIAGYWIRLLAFLFFRKEFVTNQGNVCVAVLEGQMSPKQIHVLDITMVWDVCQLSRDYSLPREKCHMRDSTWEVQRDFVWPKRNIRWKKLPTKTRTLRDHLKIASDHPRCCDFYRRFPKKFEAFQIGCRKSPPNMTRISGSLPNNFEVRLNPSNGHFSFYSDNW